ncbi:TPA: hypothetical protein ACTZGK_004106 [Raoultella planticola]
MYDREDFERFYSEFSGQTLAWVQAKRDGDKGYLSGYGIEAYWQFWKASRKAIVVTMPERVTTQEALQEGYQGDYAVGRDDVIDEITSYLLTAGLTLKKTANETQ